MMRVQFFLLILFFLPSGVCAMQYRGDSVWEIGIEEKQKREAKKQKYEAKKQKCKAKLKSLIACIKAPFLPLWTSGVYEPRKKTWYKAQREFREDMRGWERKLKKEEKEWWKQHRGEEKIWKKKLLEEKKLRNAEKKVNELKF